MISINTYKENNCFQFSMREEDFDSAIIDVESMIEVAYMLMTCEDQYKFNIEYIINNGDVVRDTVEYDDLYFLYQCFEAHKSAIKTL